MNWVKSESLLRQLWSDPRRKHLKSLYDREEAYGRTKEHFRHVNYGTVYDTNVNPLLLNLVKLIFITLEGNNENSTRYPLLIASYLTLPLLIIMCSGAIIFKVVFVMKQAVIIHVLNVIKIALFLWTSLLTPTYFLYDTILTLTVCERKHNWKPRKNSTSGGYILILILISTQFIPLSANVSTAFYS